MEGSLHKLDSLAEELCDPDLYPDRGPKDMYDSLFVRNHPRKECDTGKNLRRMATLTGEQFEFCSQTISSRLQSQNLFNDDRQLLEELVVIRSYQGCPEQGRHSDYNAGELAEAHDTCIPLSVLWALEDGSQLILFGRNGTRVVLPVLKGKFVVFRGDLGHAGAGYKQMNMRVHCYASLKDKVQRLQNKTYFMSEHSFVPRGAQARGQVVGQLAAAEANTEAGAQATMQAGDGSAATAAAASSDTSGLHFMAGQDGCMCFMHAVHNALGTDGAPGLAVEDFNVLRAEQRIDKDGSAAPPAYYTNAGFDAPMARRIFGAARADTASTILWSPAPPAIALALVHAPSPR